MSNITAVILYSTIDERLEQTIESVLWCDHVILIGSGEGYLISPDKERTKRLHWIHAPFAEDFAFQRNRALNEVKTMWAFFVDSDEIVSDALHNEILTVTREKGINGYFMKRSDQFMGRVLKHGETSNVFLLRLGRVGKGEWQRPVHEFWDIHGKTEILSEPLLHASHTSISAFLEKINRYTTIEAHYRKTLGMPFSLVQCLIYPPLKFISTYVFLLGFLDGFPGLAMSFMMSIHSLTVRIKMYEKD